MPRGMFRAASIAASALALSAHFSALFAQTSLRATRVASGLDNPDGVCAPAGDTSRLFIVEQASSGSGRIRILDLAQAPPVLLPAPYLSIAPILAGGEQGLLGLAFHPDFANNGYFFVCYTNSAGDNQVVRYQANAPFGTSSSANLTSGRPVLTIPHPGASNHNGGSLAFGPDGYLYIGAGDGGSQPFNAQTLSVRPGKILRVDVDADDYPADPANNFAIPPTNPFYGSTNPLPEIWHYGLRNPWRISFDRANGDLWIGDVGGAAVEEVDCVPAGVGGENFGWPCMEGSNCTSYGCGCFLPQQTLPVQTYAHTSGNCCIIGGYRYRGAALCDYQGLYFFGDFCSSRVWSVEWNGTSTQNLTEHTAELAAGGGPTINLITSFGEDAAGELYVCDAFGDVFRIEPGTIVDCNQNSIHDGCEIANGSGHDWNGDGLLDECQPTGSASCFGDGTTPTACPCSNAGALGRGCDNSDATGGARLDGYGDPLQDSVVLQSSGELSSTLTLFLQGDARNVNGAVFGDGVRCVSGLLIRLYASAANAGSAHAPQAGDTPISQRSTSLGDPFVPGSGQRRYYQAFYRDPRLVLCSVAGGDPWNISSMLTVIW